MLECLKLEVVGHQLLGEGRDIFLIDDLPECILPFLPQLKNQNILINCHRSIEKVREITNNKVKTF